MTEIQQLLKMSYEQCCDYLKQKYGVITQSYFCNETCRSPRESIKRTKEGLEIHHIDEDKFVLLSKKEEALKYPFKHQMGDRLVYCNVLEHLVLHIKIFEHWNNNRHISSEPLGIQGIVCYQIPTLNDIFSKYPFKLDYKKAIANAVKNLEYDYLFSLEYLMKIKKLPLNVYISNSWNMVRDTNVKQDNTIFSKIEDVFNKIDNNI